MIFRRAVSLSLMFSIAGMLVSSIVLYIVPQGRVAYWSGWTLLGLTKSEWGAIHTNLGLLMLVAGAFHVYYNWRPITTYLKNRSREFKLFTPSFNIAFAVFGLFILLTILGSPPAVWIQDLRVSLEEGSASDLGEPPYGHAEESSLRVFLRNVGMDQAAAMANLEAAGITASDMEIRILDLADQNGMTPQALHEAMKGPEDQRPIGPLPIPTGMPMGSGRMTLEAFCLQYNRDSAEAVKILEEAGWTVDARATVKDNAANNGGEGLDLLDILRERYEQGSP